MRWDVRLRPQLILLGAAVTLVVPLLASLAGADVARAWIAAAGGLMDTHRVRELTGYLALSCVLAQAALSARRRTRLPLRGSYAAWRSLHMLLGVGLLGVVLVHTGGRWGVNLNGWLLTALLLVSFTALVGKALEARAVAHQTPPTSESAARRPARPFEALATLFAFAARGQRAVAAAEAALTGAAENVWIYRATPARPRRGTSLARLRTLWLHTHVLLVAALLVLLAFHVLSVYYF